LARFFFSIAIDENAILPVSGLTNLAIIEAIYESRRTGKQVDVNIDGI